MSGHERNKRPVVPPTPPLVWCAAAVIVLALMLAAGWELLRWTLLVITLD